MKDPESAEETFHPRYRTTVTLRVRPFSRQCVFHEFFPTRRVTGTTPRRTVEGTITGEVHLQRTEDGGCPWGPPMDSNAIMTT